MKALAKTSKLLETSLSQLLSEWDGRSAILEMRDSGYPHWKQMEWVGWYFQFLCERCLFSTIKIPGPKYGNVEFDGFLEIPWDFKVHPTKNADNKVSDTVIANDRDAINKAIKQYGATGIVLAIGKARFNDENRNFQNWHKKLKGGLSNYEKERISRKAPSRLRKTFFVLKEVDIIILNKQSIRKLDSFQEGFRNADGSPRKAKILLDLKNIDPIEIIKF